MQNRLDSKIYAGFVVRFAAYFTDCIIAVALSFLIKLPLWTAASAGLDFLKKGIIFRFTIQDIAQYLVFASYFVLLTYFGHATPGKKLFRLEVITEDGSWTFVNVLYRETVGRFLSGLLNIGYVAVAVTPKKQGFHDMFCDTYVIYKDMICTEPLNKAPVNAFQGNVPMQPEMNMQGMNNGFATQGFVHQENVPQWNAPQQETVAFEPDQSAFSGGDDAGSEQNS